MTTAVTENRALKWSVAGTLFMALLGFSFALITNSAAILLDGIYSLVTFAMSLLTLKVAKLAQRPDDDIFPFGYAQFEPLLNLAKSLIILAVCAFALESAVMTISQGGRELETGSALVYALFATGGCLGIAIYMRRAAQASGSSLVDVDAKGWMIDGILSAAVCLAFTLMLLLGGGEFDPYLIYVDPVLMIVLVLISLPVPFKVLRDNLREVLQMAPPEPVRSEIRQCIERAVTEQGLQEPVVRLLKTGRTMYLNVHIVLDPDFVIGRIESLDNIREYVKAALGNNYPGLVLDLCFVGDDKVGSIAKSNMLPS